MTVETAIPTGNPARLRDRALAAIITWWRENVTLARIPLPMLSLAASFGVFQFSMLFVPWWVALAEAFAFEATYIGLATLRVETDKQRNRARLISLGSVCVSVIYNSLAAFLHRNPLILDTLDPLSRIVIEAILAILHGAPLAIVGYFVADLLLHDGVKTRAAAEPAIDWNAIITQLGDQLRVDLATQKAAFDEGLSSLRAEMGNSANTLNEAMATLEQKITQETTTLNGTVETLRRHVGQGMTTLKNNQSHGVEGFGKVLEELKGDIAKREGRVQEGIDALRQDLNKRGGALDKALDGLRGRVEQELNALRTDLDERVPTYNCRYCDKTFTSPSARGGHEPRCEQHPNRAGQEVPALNGAGA